MVMSFAAGLAYADSPPQPDRKTQALPALKEQLQERKKREKSLQDEIKTTEGEISSLRQKLISLGEDIQNTESEMRALESHVDSLNEEKNKLETQLNIDRQKSARLALALQRISQTPPEALIARPSSPLKTVQSGILMQSSIPVIQKEARMLKRNLDRLETVTAQLVEDRRRLLTTRQSLAVKQVQMRSFIDERQAYYQNTVSEHEQIQSEIKRMAAQAENLSELVAKIRQNQIDKARVRPAPEKPVKKAVLRPDTSLRKQYGGSPRLPASGIIEVGYGDDDVYGAPSRGLKIRTREESLIVSPIHGVIQYAGEFGRFGNVIIIQHDEGYHSLIAGLQRIDTGVGQEVLTGEPLGVMGSSLAGDKPVLYYELRRRGEPVDPSIKFGGLS